MSDCTSIDPLVTPYVDGELSAADRTRVDDHLRRCAPCYSRIAAEGAVRDLMRARRSGLSMERASESLRSYCNGLTGRSADGVIEVCELKRENEDLLPYLLSVQFHPERLVRGYPEYLELFRSFTAACALNREVRYEAENLCSRR